MIPIFDAHLDLAYLDVNRRDLTLPLNKLDASTTGPHPPAAVTLPELRTAGVRWALGTVFTEAGGEGPEGYEPLDVEAAVLCGEAQISVYRRWASQGHITIANHGRFDPDPADTDPIQIGILIENADPIRTPDDLAWWVSEGVVAIGLCWGRQSRYAAGNACEPDLGLAPMGIEMLEAMHALSVVCDLSHLSQCATEEALERTRGPVIASHSNCRALLGGDGAKNWQRHLSDEAIKEIARRRGVIGLNLAQWFLKPGVTDNGPRPTIADAIAHIEHICDLTGSKHHTALGTDMDGGFSGKQLCEGIEKPTDLHKLFEALHDRGWTDDELHGLASRNWLNFWEQWNADRLA